MAIDHIRNVAAFPLAIPLMAGPGSITATMLLADRANGDWLDARRTAGDHRAGDGGGLLAFLAAERLSGLLGATGNIVATACSAWCWRRWRCSSPSTAPPRPGARA